MGSVMPGLDKGGGPAMVLVALLTPWQAQWVLSSTSQAEGGEGDLGQSSGEQICPKTKRKGLKLLSEFCPAPLSFFCLEVLYFPIMTGSGSPDWLMAWNNFIRDEPGLGFSQDT